MNALILPTDRYGRLPNGKRASDDNAFLESGTYDLSGKSAMTIVRKALQVERKTFEEAWCFADEHVPPTPNPINSKTFLRRKQCTFGADYKFGNQVSHAVGVGDTQSWPTLVQIVIADARARAEVDKEKYNAVHTNFYPGGAGVGRHADDEPTILAGMPIFSYTFLANDSQARLFNVYSKSSGDLAVSTPLHDGDLLVMEGAMQSEFTHEVPVHDIRRFDGGRRINFTVRAFKKTI